MSLIIVHPFWQSSTNRTYAIEGRNYVGSLISLIESHRDVVLYEAASDIEQSLRRLRDAGAHKAPLVIPTIPNSSKLESEAANAAENAWLGSLPTKVLHCAGGCYTIYNRGTPQEFAGDCLGATMTRLRKKGFECMLEKKAAFDLDTIDDEELALRKNQAELKLRQSYVR